MDSTNSNVGGWSVYPPWQNPCAFFFEGRQNMIQKSLANNLRPNLTQSRKEKILEEYNHECQYCYGPADVVDHIIPLSYSHDNSEENLVASCWLCNLIAGDKVFKNFNRKRDYIINRRYKYIEKHPIPLWTRREFNELGRKLQKMLKDAVVICKDDEERARATDHLLSEGWKVSVGKLGIEYRYKRKLGRY